jgi:fermentation-respiration switch protein FrsA (DUF1100 family)
MKTLIRVFCCCMAIAPFALILNVPTTLAQESPIASADQKVSGIAGDWQGTLEVGGQQLHLVLHIKQSADKTLQATMESVDQGANGIPISKISFQNGRLSFTSDVAHGTYEGNLDPAGTQIDGTWSQGQPLALTFKRAAQASNIDGSWLGTLNAGAVKLRLLFQITNTPEGLQATFNSLDEGGGAIPVSSVKRDGARLTIEIKSIGSSFSGTLDKELTTIDGTWNQRGNSLPLTLKKTDIQKMKAAAPRPQEPKKPYPYHSEDVSYQNKSASDVELAATLTLPQGKGPFPAVVLITGSGPQDRDEALFGHRPFLVLSDYLTRHGIAVLRADDRGVAKSTGNPSMATTADFATDTEAGIAYLKTRPEINQQKIGLIGHSEGGMIAPMIAARNHSVAFIVMMAGTGVPGDAVLAEQTKLILMADGVSPEMAEQKKESELEVTALVKQETNSAALEKKLREKFSGQFTEAQLSESIMQMNSPWMRYFISYDPAVALSKVTCPVLVLNGEKDLQVPPKQNLPAIRKALEAGGNKHFEIVELPGLNHLFQTAKTGSPSEYAQIEETIAPIALETMASWILKQ